MVPVARELAANGAAVEFSSSGEGTRFLVNHGFRCNELPHLDVSWSPTGEFSALDTARSFPLLSLLFLKQLSSEIVSMRKFGADGVLSDSVLSSVIAGKLLQKKVVTVINQLRLESSPTTPNWARKLLTAGSIAVANEFWDMSDRILLPDLPPPYTISERNLWSIGRIAKRSRYIGFLVPATENSEDPVTLKLANEKKLKIFWQISGPEDTKAGLVTRATQIASAMGPHAVSIISLGKPSGSSKPKELPWGWMYEWCPVKDRLLQLADIIVSRSGNVSIAQFIRNAKPSILVPIPKQAEQEGNASKAEKLGIAIKIRQSSLEMESFKQGIERVRTDHITSKVREVNSVALQYDPVAEVVSELRG
jgi:UDP:flavonoid glycosyltransferase YjiC (YdhE family)